MANDQVNIVRCTFALPVDELLELKRKAARERISVNDALRQVLALQRLFEQERIAGKRVFIEQNFPDGACYSQELKLPH